MQLFRRHPILGPPLEHASHEVEKYLLVLSLEKLFRFFEADSRREFDFGFPVAL